MTLIELDLDAPPDRDAARTPLPPARYRHVGLLVTLALAAVLGGAAPLSGTVWRQLGVIPAAAGVEAPIQLAGGRLYTAGSSGGQRLLTAWALRPEPHRVWTAEVPVSATFDPANDIFSPVSVRHRGDVVLITAGLSTTVVDAATGRVRWNTAARVATGADGTGVVVERIFRAGTLYDQESGDPGVLFFSADGQPHTEPPVRTEVRGLDLATGATLWTATPPGSVTADVVAGEVPAVLVTASERLTLYDARTGAVLRERELPEYAGKPPTTSEVTAGVVRVGYDDAALETGFDARTLEPLWSRGLDSAGMDPVSCSGLVCTGDGSATQVLDPRTGIAAWSVMPKADLTVRAGQVLQSDPASGAPLRLVDRATGATLVALSGWAAEVTGFADHVLLLRRDNPGGGQLFGAVLPGHPEVLTLGVAAVGGGDCAGDDRYVVCRDAQGLRIWAYRF